MNRLLIFLLTLRYEHLHHGIDAMRMDLQGAQRISIEQEQQLARMQANALNLLRRINALRYVYAERHA